MLHSLQSTRVEMAIRKIETYQNKAKNCVLFILSLKCVEMASRKIQTYQNKAKNLYNIYFVFDLHSECKFIKTKQYSD